MISDAEASDLMVWLCSHAGLALQSELAANLGSTSNAERMATLLDGISTAAKQCAEHVRANPGLYEWTFGATA